MIGVFINNIFNSLPVTFALNLCKQFRPRSGPTYSKLFDDLMVFLKYSLLKKLTSKQFRLNFLACKKFTEAHFTHFNFRLCVQLSRCSRSPSYRCRCSNAIRQNSRRKCFTSAHQCNKISEKGVKHKMIGTHCFRLLYILLIIYLPRLFN